MAGDRLGGLVPSVGPGDPDTVRRYDERPDDGLAGEQLRPGKRRQLGTDGRRVLRVVEHEHPRRRLLTGRGSCVRPPARDLHPGRRRDVRAHARFRDEHPGQIVEPRAVASACASQFVSRVTADFVALPSQGPWFRVSRHRKVWNSRAQ